MILEWRCKRSNEKWPTQLATQSYVPYNGTGSGCFGDVGPGVLGFAAGQWDLIIDTSYLEPLINYDIQFVVRKDVRSANADVTLFVQQSPAPVVEVRFVNYCYSKIVAVMHSVQLQVTCTIFREFCTTYRRKIGGDLGLNIRWANVPILGRESENKLLISCGHHRFDSPQPSYRRMRLNLRNYSKFTCSFL